MEPPHARASTHRIYFFFLFYSFFSYPSLAPAPVSPSHLAEHPLVYLNVRQKRSYISATPYSTRRLLAHVFLHAQKPRSFRLSRSDDVRDRCMRSANVNGIAKRRSGCLLPIASTESRLAGRCDYQSPPFLLDNYLSVGLDYRLASIQVDRRYFPWVYCLLARELPQHFDASMYECVCTCTTCTRRVSANGTKPR